MDRIVVLKDKTISEQGTYKELLKKKGPFQEFLFQYLASDSEDIGDLAGGYLSYFLCVVTFGDVGSFCCAVHTEGIL